MLNSAVWFLITYTVSLTQHLAVMWKGSKAWHDVMNQQPPLTIYIQPFLFLLFLTLSRHIVRLQHGNVTSACCEWNCPEPQQQKSKVTPPVPHAHTPPLSLSLLACDKSAPLCRKLTLISVIDSHSVSIGAFSQAFSCHNWSKALLMGGTHNVVGSLNGRLMSSLLVKLMTDGHCREIHVMD